MMLCALLGGDYLKKTCVGCQSVYLPLPDEELIPLARFVYCLSSQQLPLSIVGGSPYLLRLLGDNRTDGREFMCVKRFNKNVFMQCFRQA